jgi:protease IV
MSTAPVPQVTTNATVSPAASTIVIRQSEGSLLWRLLAFLGWAAFAIAAFFALAQFLSFRSYFDNSHGITEKYHSGAKLATDKIAIIAVEGIIADADGFVKGQIDRIREDSDVKAVVVRIDSPGGTVTASDFIWHHLNKLRQDRKIPLVVSMGGIAASGGYYVAMAVGDQTQSIYAEPTTTTGSIGVMFPHYDFSGLLERFDVKDDSLVTHPRKEMASMTKPMTEDHRALLQAYIDESFSRFKRIVQAGRPKFKQDPAALDKLATGEIFSAERAKQNGLVDEIGFLEDAIARAAKLAAVPEKNLRVVEYRRPVSFMDFGVFAAFPEAPSRANRMEAMLEMTIPRAFYLASTVPPLLSSYVTKSLTESIR